jgi:hypothetical protein
MIIKIKVESEKQKEPIEIETDHIVRFSGCLEDAIIKMADGMKYRSKDIEQNRIILSKYMRQK